MAVAYPVYALSNADTLYGVLNGMAALMRSHAFRQALLAFGLLGLFWAIIVMAVQRNPKRLLLYLFFATTFMHFAVQQTVSVMVIGQTDGKSYTVEHVPALIALPASWMSTLGFAGARIVDTAYTLSGKNSMFDALTLTGGKPFSITSQLIRDASTYRLRDSYLRASLLHFIADCGVPLLANGALDLHTLMGSDDLWGVFSATRLNPALSTLYYGDETAPVPRGEVMTCLAAHARIDKSLPDARARMEKRLSPELGAGIGAMLFQSVMAFHVNNHLYNPSAGNYLQQAALLDLFSGSLQKHLAQTSHNGALLQSLAVEQAVRATELNWQTTAEVFARTFGYLYTVVQLVIYAVAPILCLLAIFPGVMRTLGRRYVMLLAWFPLTFMMLAIANDLIVSWTHNELGNVFGQFGGLVQASQALITAKAAKLQAVGAYIVSLVPLLAWAILEGGQYAISQIITHSGAQTFGHQAGQVAASGNLSLDSQQYETLSANKASVTRQVDIGVLPVTSHIGGGDGLLRADFGGESVTRNAAPDMVQFSEQVQAQFSHSSGSTTHFDRGNSVADSHGLGDQASVSQSASNSTTTSTQLGWKLPAFGKRATQAMLNTAAGLGIPMNAAVAASIGSDLAQAGVAAEQSAQAADQGNRQTATAYRQEAQGWFHHALQQFNTMPWYSELGVGALTVAGAVALYGTGVGEALTGVAAAEIAGESLGAAAVEEGVAASVAEAAAHITTAETASAASAAPTAFTGKLIRGGIGGAVAGGLLKGISGGIQQAYRGEHRTNLDARHSGSHQVSVDARKNYSETDRVGQQHQYSDGASRVESFQTPGRDFNDALDIATGSAPEIPQVAQAKQAYRQNQSGIQDQSASLHHQSQTLDKQAEHWIAEAKRAIQQRDGMNQLTKTRQQKDVDQYDISS